MQKIMHFIAAFSLIMVIASAYAEASKPSDITTISLYQQPNTKSSVVGSIAPNQPIIPIFTQGEWTKIADPSNGNVGWVSNKTLKQQGIPTIKTTTQSLNSPNQTGYKTEQYFGFTPMNDEQIEGMMKKWQKQSHEMQTIFSRVLQQNAKIFDAFAKEFQDADFQFPMMIPVLQPVVIMPNKDADKVDTTEKNVKAKVDH